MAAVERSWGAREPALEWIPYVSPNDVDDEETTGVQKSADPGFVTLSHPGTSTSFFATDEAGFADFWRECWVGSANRKDSSLQLATRRFVETGDRDAAEDKIVDLMVCAEALFIGDKHDGGISATK